MLASRRQGSGARPLVLLHGFLGAGRNLSSLARLLLQRQPDLLLHLPDLPGHGASAPSPRGAGFPAMAAEMERFLADLGQAEPVDLAGHSFGARVALATLDLAPQRVARVAILDMTPGSLHAPAADRMVADLQAAPDRFPSRAEAEAYFRAHTGDEQLIAWLSMNLERKGDGAVGWRIDRDYLAAVHAATRTVDLWPVVERHPERIALLRGGRSPLVSSGDLERLAALGIEVETLEASGHFLHVDAPEATARWLQRRVSSAR
ncbi:MAG: alpha/beta fold hydrolase [Deltaproteobacteria bacterium]|nr:alpha/beta fold hydrolase [Deltaproteobacteria bacterium]